MRNVLVVPSLLLALAGSACSPTLAPIYSPVEPAGINAAGVPYTSAEIDRAAIAGAQAKGWTVISAGPGATVAQVSSGGHEARVRIVTSDSGWQIVHEQSSPGLKFHNDERHGDVIHRRYNHWVRLLDEAIRQQLALQAAVAPTAPVVEAAPMPAAPTATP